MLARMHILAGDMFCLVVGALLEYDTFEAIPDIIGGVSTFIRRVPSGKCVTVSNTDYPCDSGYSTAHIYPTLDV